MKSALRYILGMVLVDIIAAPIAGAILTCIFSIWDKNPWMEQFRQHTAVIFVVFLILVIIDVIKGKY